MQIVGYRLSFWEVCLLIRALSVITYTVLCPLGRSFVVCVWSMTRLGFKYTSSKFCHVFLGKILPFIWFCPYPVDEDDCVIWDRSIYSNRVADVLFVAWLWLGCPLYICRARRV